MPARLDPGAVHTITKLSNCYPVHDLLLSFRAVRFVVTYFDTLAIGASVVRAGS